MEETKPLAQSRKRPLQHEIQDSPHYKMRGLLKDLRPHFIEVWFLLITPVHRILCGFSLPVSSFRAWCDVSFNSMV